MFQSKDFSRTNTYEYLITNLPFSFVLNDIKEIYHKRWQIEVSFRYLKHANGLLHFHCKKPEFLKQEIYANLILYNFGIFLANEAADENRRQNRVPAIRQSSSWNRRNTFWIPVIHLTE